MHPTGAKKRKNSFAEGGNRRALRLNPRPSCLVWSGDIGQNWLVDLFEYEKVTDAKCGKRGLLQRIGNLSQKSPNTRAAGVNAVVAGKDLCVQPDENGLPNEQVQETVAGIGAHVRGKLTAQRVRQIVDQRCIAKMVYTLPVVAVGLKRKEAVGHENGCAAPDPQDAYDFGRGQTVIPHMLQDLVRQNQIESRVGIGELLTLAEVQRCVGRVSCCNPQMLTSMSIP